MRPHRNLKVLHAAELADAEIDRFLTSADKPVPHAAQLRDSAHSIPSNIGEGFGRKTLADRNHFLAMARGSAQESIRHLVKIRAVDRMTDREFWHFQNRLVAISKMLESLIYSRK